MFQYLITHMPIVWLVLMIFFAVVEGITVTLASIWFAVGALAALLVSLVCGNLWAQAFTFALVSLLALCLIRPMAKRFFQSGKPTPTNADRILKRTGIVTENIDNLAATGQVKVAGQVWTARSADGNPISAGVEVTILRIEGVKIFVEPAAVSDLVS